MAMTESCGSLIVYFGFTLLLLPALLAHYYLAAYVLVYVQVWKSKCERAYIVLK